MSDAAVRIEPGPGMVTVHLRGEIDLASADELRHRSDLALVTNDVNTIVIDLTDVTYVGSAALGALIRIRNRAISSDKHFLLAHVPPQARRVLHLSGLAEPFGVAS